VKVRKLRGFGVQQRDRDRTVRVSAVLCNVRCAAVGYRQDSACECCIVQCLVCSSGIQTGECV
jgi:hypothetical protein